MSPTCCELCSTGSSDRYDMSVSSSLMLKLDKLEAVRNIYRKDSSCYLGKSKMLFVPISTCDMHW